MRRFATVGALVALVFALLPSGAAPKPLADAEVALDGLPPSLTGDADVRALQLGGPSVSSFRAAQALQREVPDVFVKWNARMGTAKHVFSDAGYLTASAGRAVGEAGAERIARAWIGSHRTLFGLSTDAVRTLRITRNAALPQGGVHALVFRQHYGAIPTFAGGTIGVNIARDGRISTVWADTGPTGTLRATPAITAEQALRAVANREGVRTLNVTLLGRRTGGDRLAIFAPGGGYTPHNARLVAFPSAGGPVLGWRVFYAKGPQEMLSTVVDARSGQVLFRHNQVDHAEGDQGRVFRNYPGAPKGGAHEVVSFEGDPTASPEGWVAGQAGAPATTTGNNVVAFTDWGWPKLAAGGFAPVLALAQFNPVPDTMPVSPDRSFDFEFANAWNQDCSPAGSTPVNDIENPSYATDRESSVTNIFYFGNKIHDFSYRYGFTEKFGNMQLDNFDRGDANSKDLDPIRFMAQAGILGGNLNNAFMFTPADGGEPTQFVDPDNPTKVLSYIPPFSGMFLWRPIPSFQGPCVDGDYDASTAYHEYTHGISNRMTGSPDDADALNAHQSGAMGEAWSDWVAHIILDAENLENRTADGIYITGNTVTGIRHFALDRNPLTYGDIGFGRFGPEVHDDGEIWSGTLWDMRTALVRKYGKARGIDRVTRLVFDGMGTQPRLPDMLQARDAIIKAAMIRYPGDVSLLWQVFARRGMGRSARSRDASDVNPKPGFDAPTGNGALAGAIHDVGGKPLPAAKIVIGLGEGKPAGVTTTSRSGAYKIVMAPGSYPVSVAAAGYGIQKLGTVTVAAGKTTTKSVTLNRNLASAGWGAAVTGGLPAGDPGLALIDDHEFTGQAVKVGDPVTIRLAGKAAATVRAVSVSPKPASGGTVKNATGYIVELSADGRKWTKVYEGGIKRYKPRPSALQWMRPTKSVPGIRARFARLTVTDTLGGGPDSIIANLQV
ncbi:MAG: M36 family metallopeptidase, partial [Actinomycetota bacterium]